MYVHVYSKMKKKYGLTDLVTIQVLRLWEGKCILFKIPTEGPKKVYHSKFVGFFFLIFTEGPKKFIIQNFLDFFLKFLNKTHFIFVYLQKKFSQIH